MLPHFGPSVLEAKDENGLDVIILTDTYGFSARVHLYGGQVTSWKDHDGNELLFLSSKAIFKPPKAIRGGIQVCFPQFGEFGKLERDGFARNRFWTKDSNPPALSSTSHQKAVVDLILQPTEQDLKIWPHRFELRLRITLGPLGELALTTRVRNTDQKPFSFKEGLSACLSVSDTSEVRIEGLETLDYLDVLNKNMRGTEQGDALTFEGEVYKIYLNCSSKDVAIIDHERKRTYVLNEGGFSDAAVWNLSSRTIPDLGDNEYKQMICVAAVAPGDVDKTITLKPQEEWKGRLQISTEGSSFSSKRFQASKAEANIQMP